MQNEVRNDKVLNKSKLTTGEKLLRLFIKNKELYPWQAYRLLKHDPHFRGRYQWIRKLFYVARRLNLISFTRQGKGKTQIPKRFYKLTPRSEADPRWRLLHAEPYPSSAIGGLNYTKGKSTKGHNGH